MRSNLGTDTSSDFARRMIIFACEDIGMADPQALVVAMAARPAQHVHSHRRAGVDPRLGVQPADSVARAA